MTSVTRTTLMMIQWMGMLVLLYVVVILLQAGYTAISSPLRKLPGPWHSRFTRVPLSLAVLSGRRMYYIHELHARYGKVVRIGPDEVSVADPASIKTIYIADGGYRKSKWYPDSNTLPRDGIFAMRDKKEHGERRRLFARPFSKSQIRQNWEPTVREKVELAVQKILKEGAEKGTVDVLKWWMCMATDISANLMFGESFGMLEKGEKNDYIKAIEAALMGSGIGAELPLVRAIGRHVPHPAFQRLFGGVTPLLSYGKQAVRNARAGGDKKNIFSGLIAKADEGGLDDLDIQLEASNLITAGSDTSANTLAYMTWSILQRPTLKLELEKELAAVRPDFTEHDLETLPLLNAVIDEVLRLYSVAPDSLPRTVPEGGVSLCGFFIPAGITVSSQTYTMHRDPALFPDPEKFDPSRWMSEQSEEARLAYFPFGGGARTCIGLHLARMEMRLATAVFFRECRGRFKLAKTTTPASMAMQSYFLMAPISHRCEIELC